MFRFAKKPNNVTAGIRAVEKMLADAEGTVNPLTRRRVRSAETGRIVVGPVQRERIVVRPVQRTRVVVEPVYRAYWQMKDWKVEGNRLVGRYQVGQRSFEGYITGYKTRRPQFFIVRPPKELRNHPHSACFMWRGNGRFFVHFGTKPTNPDGGICEIEKVLDEALRLPRR